MSTSPVLICGEDAGKVRSFLEEHSRLSVDFHMVEESEQLPAVATRPAPGLVIVLGEMIADPLFQSWRRRRSDSLPLIHIPDRSNGKFDEEVLLGVTTIVEDDLAALPYIIETICNGNGGARRRPAASDDPSGGEDPAVWNRTIVGGSRGIRLVLESARKVLNVKSSLLVLGESGTGKEMIASMVHHESLRLGRPFVKVNCAAIPETLLESELFGIEKNTATNVDGRIGKFELADGGTVFLDEIGDMSLLTQSKVLRILQEKEFERVGGSRSIRVNVRVIAATNKDLIAEIRRRRFRSDLLYRLNVITIRIPPLRERLEDVEPLVEHFVRHFCRENGLPLKVVSREALDALLRYEWPGNVRELENAVERAVVMGEGRVVGGEDFPQSIRDAEQKHAENGGNPYSFRRRVREFEKNILITALDDTGWVQARAARKLGISERSMWHLFKKYDLGKVREAEKLRSRDRAK